MTWMDGAGRVKRTLPEDEAALAHARKVEKRAGFDRVLEEIIHVAEMDERYEEFIALQKLERGRHYGVWHRERGWLVNGQQEIIVSTSRAVAVAQCDTARRYPSSFWNASLYEVRCIEEWAEEGQDDG